MDYIRFHCPSCHHLLVVPPEAAGLSGPCPQCQTTIQGPQSSPSPQPQPLNPPPPVTQEPAQVAVPIQEPILETPPQIEPDFVAVPEPFNASAGDTHVAPTPIQQTLAVENRIPPEILPQEEAPERESDPSPSRPKKERKRSGGLSFLQALLMSFFFSVAFFIFGFFLGKSGSISWQDLVAEKEKQTNEVESLPDPLVEDEEIPIQSLTPPPSKTTQSPSPTTSISNAQASLEAFLACSSWSTRNAFVLYPDEVLSKMAAYDEKYGSGPIAAESITMEGEAPNQKVFWVKTANNEDVFSTILIQDQGRWLVDWDGFADFYYNRLDTFAAGDEGPMSGLFRVYLKAAPGETAPLSPARCLVMAPQSNQSHQVNSAAGSPARKKLADIFQAYLQADEETFKKLMAGPGIPLIVEISRNGASNPTLQMEKIVTTSWAPLPAKKFSKENSSSFY